MKGQDRYTNKDLDEIAELRPQRIKLPAGITAPPYAARDGNTFETATRSLNPPARARSSLSSTSASPVDVGAVRGGAARRGGDSVTATTRASAERGGGLRRKHDKH